MRRGGPGDEAAVLAMLDEAVAWLVARGQAGQWGDRPWSQDEKGRRTVGEIVRGGGLHLLESGGHAAGAVAVGDRFDYAHPVDVPELFIRLLITSRAFAGRSFGRLLVDRAAAVARERGALLLRVDCWAGAPGLVGWYESCGFSRTHTFSVDGWQGQVLEMEVR
jgi:GNAT superfamily N-acetyltransferase